MLAPAASNDFMIVSVKLVEGLFESKQPNGAGNVVVGSLTFAPCETRYSAKALEDDEQAA